MTQPCEDSLLSKRCPQSRRELCKQWEGKNCWIPLTRSTGTELSWHQELQPFSQPSWGCRPNTPILEHSLLFGFPSNPVWMFNKKDVPISLYDFAQINFISWPGVSAQFWSSSGLLISVMSTCVCDFANSRVAEPYPRTVFNFGNITKIIQHSGRSLKRIKAGFLPSRSSEIPLNIESI